MTSSGNPPDELEALDKSDMSDVDRSTALEKLAASIKATDPKRAELLEWETWAFRLVFSHSGIGRRELNLLGISFPNHAVDYFETRLSVTTNCFVRSRLADFIWETRKKHTYAQMSIDAHLERVKVCAGESRYLELVESLQRAADLSVSFNDMSRIARIEWLAVQILQSLGPEDYRWGLEVVETILAIRKHVNSQTLKDAYAFCEKAYNWFKGSNADNFHIQRDYSQLLSQLAKALGLQTEFEAWRKERPEAFVREAEWKETNYPNGEMVASHFYTEAAQAYRDLGMTEKAQEMLKLSEVKMREGWAKTKPLKVETKVPREAVEQEIDKYTKGKSAKEILVNLSTVESLIPRYETAKEAAEKSPPIASFSLFENSRKVAGTLTSEEIQAAKIARLFMVNCSTNCQLLIIPILRKAIEAGCTPAVFTEVLGRSNSLSADRCAFLRTAFEHFLAGDNLSCVHVMLPQIEAWLRDTAAMIGLPTTYIDKKIIRVRMLQTILDSLKEHVSAHVWAYANAILVDDWAFGLRDRIAHGLLETKQVNDVSAALLIHVCLLLSSITWKPIQESPTSS